jgi:hypothetical protein
LFLNAAQCAYRRSCQGLSGACRSGCRYSLLEIGVEQFVRVQFRRITRQVEAFDPAGVLGQPLLDQLSRLLKKAISP